MVKEARNPSEILPPEKPGRLKSTVKARRGAAEVVHTERRTPAVRAVFPPHLQTNRSDSSLSLCTTGQSPRVRGRGIVVSVSDGALLTRPENRKADQWPKLAVDEPGAHIVEFLGFGDRYRRRHLPPRSLAHLQRQTTETKRGQSKAQADPKASHNKILARPQAAPGAGLHPDQGRRAARLEMLPAQMGHSPTGQYLVWIKNRPLPYAGGAHTEPNPENTS